MPTYATRRHQVVPGERVEQGGQGANNSHNNTNIPNNNPNNHNAITQC